MLQSRLTPDLRQNPKGILVISLHPGAVDTFTQKLSSPFLTKYLVKPLARSVAGLTDPDDGALTSVFAAIGKRVREQPEEYAGAYLVPVGKVEKVKGPAADEELATRLIKTTEEFLNGIGLGESA